MLMKPVTKFPTTTTSLLDKLHGFERKLSSLLDSHTLEPPFYDFGNHMKPIFCESKVFNSGGMGKVFRARIHHDSMDSSKAGSNYYRDLRQHGYFAVKQLKSRNSLEFSREFKALNRFTRERHQHIVPLFASYRMGGQYHLVFPWADSDLAIFWRLNPQPQTDKFTISWSAKQMLGIASALSVIHGFQDGTEERRWFGVHHDVKPGNILFFSDKFSQPVLKIADFGSTCIHTRDKQSDLQTEDVNHTPVYRAPEIDLQSKATTSAYDVWSFGCVVLETLTWLIHGNRGLERLISARSDQKANSLNHDAFFRLQRDLSGGLTAQLKPEIQLDYTHASSFTNDVLNLVRDEMLVVDKHKRSSSRDIRKALSKICEMLDNDEAYSSPHGGCDTAVEFKNPQLNTDRPDRHLEMVFSNQHAGKKRRLGRDVDISYYSVPATENLHGGDSQNEAKLRQKFACPFYKAGIIASEYSRACKGPGWADFHRLKEHILRCHTPDKYKNERFCRRCDEGFDTEELFMKHQCQDPPCIIKEPEIIYGKMTREQAINLRSTKRKSTKVSDEDRWFDIFRSINEDCDPNIDNISPYHETTVSTLDTLSTQSPTGISQYKNYLRQPLTGGALQELAADFGESFGISDPEVCRAMAAKLRNFQLKDLQKFDENQLKPAYTYEIPLSNSNEKAEVVGSSSLQTPGPGVNLSQLLVDYDNEEVPANLWSLSDNI
ncbi:hypothetical protein G7Z17_g6228 [Cylindrodendrum hubeiense]|uniref:Protein kinase domain-containing protein n=1 Tax=Cylindrodendrum hubeiense TaxID=595255 RepID=A0A9P5H5P8_9HYPO|nr:hypothetical protein G7Z17_g6228 [Cylindrodendrum hubeiense]